MDVSNAAGRRSHLSPSAVCLVVLSATRELNSLRGVFLFFFFFSFLVAASPNAYAEVRTQRRKKMKGAGGSVRQFARGGPYLLKGGLSSRFRSASRKQTERAAGTNKRTPLLCRGVGDLCCAVILGSSAGASRFRGVSCLFACVCAGLTRRK